MIAAVSLKQQMKLIIETCFKLIYFLSWSMIFPDIFYFFQKGVAVKEKQISPYRK